MDAAREREIRELAARLIASKRHHRIGVVLGELLGEIDVLREGETWPDMDVADALDLIQRCADALPAGARDGVQRWRDAVQAKMGAYPA